MVFLFFDPRKYLCGPILITTSYAYRSSGILAPKNPLSSLA